MKNAAEAVVNIPVGVVEVAHVCIVATVEWGVFRDSWMPYHFDYGKHNDRHYQLKHTDLKVKLLLVQRLVPNYSLLNGMRYDIQNNADYEQRWISVKVVALIIGWDVR